MKRRSVSMLATFATVAVALAALNACILKSSPAPGCRVTFLTPVGGCYGKTAMLDLSVDAKPECIDIGISNCTGGRLQVDNRCTMPFVLAGVPIELGETRRFDVDKIGDGYSLVKERDVYGDIVPATDVRVQAEGRLGSQKVRVEVTKTRQLCE